MPDNGTARACSRLGPARLSPYVATRLASRPIAVLPIPSRCPALMCTYGAVGTGVLSTYSHDTCVNVCVWRGVAECDAGVRRRSE
jgi:hypothetical protein